MTKCDRAKRWRQKHGWTLDELALRTGYSVSSIVWFERGHGPTGNPIDKFAWWRYKRICHSVELDDAGESANLGNTTPSRGKAPAGGAAESAKVNRIGPCPEKGTAPRLQPSVMRGGDGGETGPV
jgi:hypothetical protein